MQTSLLVSVIQNAVIYHLAVEDLERVLCQQRRAPCKFRAQTTTYNNASLLNTLFGHPVQNSAGLVLDLGTCLLLTRVWPIPQELDCRRPMAI